MMYLKIRQIVITGCMYVVTVLIDIKKKVR